jgi:ribonuclease H2 subunit A
MGDEDGVVLSDDEVAPEVARDARAGQAPPRAEQQPELQPKPSGRPTGAAPRSVGLQLEAEYTESDVPELCAGGVPCCVGIDEAGRGPVLGPMVYGLCYWPLSEAKSIDALGFNDSKQLSEAERERMLREIEQQSRRIGRVLCDLPAEFISTSMLLRGPISLNELSYVAAIEMVRRVVAQGVNVAELYVDAVGNCDRYAERLRREFPGAVVTVKPKADALYKVVGAASICAKVTRDRAIKAWSFRELYAADGQLLSGRRHFAPLDCSGYPGDEKTVRWLESNGDRVFGFPSVVRHSWKTTKNLYGEADDEMAEEAAEDKKRKRAAAPEPLPGGKLPQLFAEVEWEDLAAAEEQGGATAKLATFLTAVKRHRFFQDRRLEHVTSLTVTQR